MQHPDYPYGAEIKWTKQFSNEEHWDDVATWGLETFGLPGDRYVTDVNVNDMTWWFRTPQDRMMFVLRNGHSRCRELC